MLVSRGFNATVIRAFTFSACRVRCRKFAQAVCVSLLVTRMEIPFRWFPHALIYPTNNLLDSTGGNERAIITSVVSFLYGYGEQSKICVCFATKAMWHKRISDYGEVFYTRCVATFLHICF